MIMAITSMAAGTATAMTTTIPLLVTGIEAARAGRSHSTLRICIHDVPQTTSADTAQCSTTSHDAATDAPAMSQSDVAVLAETFRLLGDQSRLKILLQWHAWLGRRGTSPKARPVAVPGQPSPAAAARCALVRGERQTKHIFYSIADQHVSQVLQDMAVHISEDKADD